jgi:hypothetical protein
MISSHRNRFPRRGMLRAGLLGGLGLTLADYLRLAEAGTTVARADAVIFVHLEGGPSHLDTLDLKPEAPAEERTPFASIPTAVAGLRACEHLPRLAAVLGKFTLMRGWSHGAGAHPQANQWFFTGSAPAPGLQFPALGSVALVERPSPSDIPGFVAIPSTEMHPGFLGVANAPFKTTSVPAPGKPYQVRGLALGSGMTVERVRGREELLRDLDTRLGTADNRTPLLEGIDRFGKQALSLLLSPRTRDAFDTSREAPSIAGRFSADPLSQSLLLAARLVEHGVRFVTVSHGGWDTHLDNFPLLQRKLLPALDAGLPALVQTLHDKGLLTRTLVVAGGEFGRTPSINKNGGRDHWPRAGWMLLAGGGAAAGKLVGGTDRKGHGPDDSTHLTPDDLAATIYHLLGIDPKKEYTTPGGRTVTLVPNGKVLADLLA